MIHISCRKFQKQSQSVLFYCILIVKISVYLEVKINYLEFLTSKKLKQMKCKLLHGVAIIKLSKKNSRAGAASHSFTNW